ncbi:ribosomal L7Ae/L30e/S12e/Gadd45 family protein [Candidatus Woesearchaeota archaeon]|nr:ribosomal L7Ae/L30e/S12e/Gadd45 family protein [Candidatus Woesearchaeota archaeon]
MAKEQNQEKELNEVKTEVQKGTIVAGGARVLQFLKEGKLSKVYLARNCPSPLRSDVEHYARLAEVPLVDLEITNEELGVVCKKNFFVSVLGVRGA